MTRSSPESLPAAPGGSDTAWQELVIDLAQQVPAGRATTYGALAEAARACTRHGGPRQVGAVMAQLGGAVGAWWRVVRADGTLPEPLAQRATPHYRAEGTPLTAGGAVDLHRAMWEVDAGA